MKIEDFTDTIKNAKLHPLHSNNYDLKVTTNKEHTKQRIHTDYTCQHCKTQIKKGITITFYKPEELTIFEGELIYSLFAENRKMPDYGNYHKCIAGQKFIKNIKEISESIKYP